MPRTKVPNESLTDLLAKWKDSYRANANHALKDAERNLKGFTHNLKKELNRFSVDYAFLVAIKNTLKQHGVN
jgi:hypothetical protein